MQTYDCIVVGAGISGLSVAYGLSRRDARVVVVERAATVGGALCSETTDDGFVLDHGTQTISSDNPTLWQHFGELGIAQDRLIAKSQRVYLPHRGHLQPLSISPFSMVRSPLLSTRGKLRLFAEPLLPRTRAEDESITSFFDRRLGPEFMRGVVDPFVAGVFGGDPDNLSMRSMFPHLWKLEQHHGSLTWGLISQIISKKQHNGHQKRETFNFRRGLGSWPSALADALGPDRVWTNTEATAVTPEERGWSVTISRDGHQEKLFANRLVLAVPAHVAARLVADIEPAAAESLKAMAHPPLSVIHLGYHRDDITHPLDGFGMLCPRQEQCHTLGNLWMSTTFAGRAPDGSVLTTTFVGGARRPELAMQDDEAIISMVKEEQQQLIGARRPPQMVRLVRWQHSVPQYDAAHPQRVGMCNRLEARWPGLYLAGNYRDGFSAEHCWERGKTLAEEMVLPTPKQSEEVEAS